MILKLIRFLNIPKWLIHFAFSSEQNINHPYLRLLLKYFDIQSSLIWKKARLNKVKIKMQLIGHIHIPKTGGTYTIDILQDVLPSFINFSHVLLRQERSDTFCPVGLIPIKESKVKSFFLFATIRNPLTFLVSYYYHAGGFMQKYRNTNHYDFEVANKSFAYLVNTVLDREDKWPSRKFLYSQLFNQPGECIIDWVNRREHLNEDLEQFSARFGFDFEAKKPKRVSGREKPYSEYYSDELLQRVSTVYAREIKLFGYNGFETINPLLEIKPLDKTRLRYDYVTDNLFLDDMEL